ncbi:MAG: dTDP-4-dehydrorhamnose reductase [Clostridiaceae bacterium]|nr:dTDP-4-dehydrorhamnose reductase [Clostridiaceae bacterium]
MKICILGGTGQLGYELNKVFLCKKPISLGKHDVDITDLDMLHTNLTSINPDIIIHCAGFTDVDQCEVNKEVAFSVNTLGTSNVAKISEEIGAKLVYISSDYVFDGISSKGYDEKDNPNPLNIYGRSKYKGEIEVKQNTDKYFIIRTSCLFGSKGKNFIKSILSLSNHSSLIKAVHDEKCSPTYTGDLAEAITKLIEEDSYGNYHLVNTGGATWYEMAQETLKMKNIHAKIIPVLSEEIERKAIRPKNSTLNNNSHIKLRPWKEALWDYLNKG